jgi:hypothetical protein
VVVHKLKNGDNFSFILLYFQNICHTSLKLREKLYVVVLFIHTYYSISMNYPVADRVRFQTLTTSMNGCLLARCAL